MIRIERRPRGGDHLILLLEGELSAEDSARLRLAADPRTLRPGIRTVRLDLGGVGSLDLEGLPAILLLGRDLEKSGIGVELVGATGEVRDLLLVTGLLRRWGSEEDRPGRTRRGLG